MNHLYYGDNLEVLRRHIKDETVDLVYLDPPFKGNQDYNVLFAQKGGTTAATQFKALRIPGKGNFAELWPGKCRYSSRGSTIKMPVRQRTQNCTL